MNQRIYNEMLNLKSKVQQPEALTYLVSCYNWNPEWSMPSYLVNALKGDSTLLDLTPEEDEQQGTVQIFCWAYSRDNNKFIEDISILISSELESIRETLATEDLADDDWEGYYAYLDEIGYLIYALQKTFQTDEAKKHWALIREIYQECLDLINPMNEIQGLEPNTLEGSIVENEFTKIYF